MSLMADALQPLIVKGILSISGRIELASIPDAIMSPRAAYDLDFDDPNHGVLFDFRDPGFVITATAADCCRFSGSAFQTASSITDVSFDRDSMPWELIKFLLFSILCRAHNYPIIRRKLFILRWPTHFANRLLWKSNW